MTENSTEIAVRNPGIPSLYEIEDTLAALFETEALVTPEQEEEFQRELANQLQLAVNKRDRVAAFIKTCEAHAKFAGEEVKRLTERKRMFEAVADKVRAYVMQVIESMRPDQKGKLKKLEGERFTMSARACPVSVEISDETLVPIQYKNATITMPAELWEELKGRAGLALDLKWKNVSCCLSVDKTAIKKELESPPVPCTGCDGIGMVPGADGAPVQCFACGGACNRPRTVPGADLIVGKLSLQIR